MGSCENDSEVVGAASRVTKTPSPIEMVLRLWKNGFSVDNGTIRDYQDPTNKEFLDSITRGWGLQGFFLYTGILIFTAIFFNLVEKFLVNSFNSPKERKLA